MAILIDGYNLLNATGITGDGPGRTSLERARTALLNFLETVLSPEEARSTTVVFDAHDPPPGLPRVVRHGAITVRFSTGFADADALIELLVRTDSAPRRMTVVSSDHRVQRAGRRRRARVIDSEDWYVEIVQTHRIRMVGDSVLPDGWKPRTPLSPEEVREWLEQFGGEAGLNKMVAEAEAIALSETERLSDTNSPPDETSGQDDGGRDPIDDEKPHPSDATNPFPPGYGEDLLADWDDE